MDRFTYDRTRRVVMLGDKVYWDDIDARPGAIIAEALGNEDYATRCLADLREQLRAATARADAAEAECERLRAASVSTADMIEFAVLRADAALGALVRRMPADYSLCHDDPRVFGVDGEPFWSVEAHPRDTNCAAMYMQDTPEAALAAALAAAEAPDAS